MAFQLFSHFDQPDSTRSTAADEFYTMLDRLREAAITQQHDWAAYQNFVDYADICFWAIRKHEYSFIANAFAKTEAEAGRPLRVLDVGCGVVPMCNWISSRGHAVTALDPLAADIEFLVRNDLNGLYGSNVAYRVSRAEQLPFADATFDVVTCVSVLEHIVPGNDLLALWEMARVLKPGGTLLITFDVSPNPVETPDSDARIDRRAYTYPFTMRTAGDLITRVAKVFEVSTTDLPPELATISWEQVFDLWRAVQEHDRRDNAIRHYLAMGNTLKRRATFQPLSADEMLLATLRGQAALEHRAAFFERHAQERLKVINDLSSALEQQQAQPLPPRPVSALERLLKGRQNTD